MNNTHEIEISLLGFIYTEPKHGYDLYKDISDLSGIGIVWRVKMGKLYAMLHRLENNQWVISNVTQAGNRPQRNQYSITDMGRKVFDEWLASPVQKGRDFRIIFLLKMYFALERGENNALQLIAVQRDACRNWVDDFTQKERVGEGQPDFNQIVLNFRITQINGYLHWLDWCREHIQKEGTKQ